jgi:hypothetical protein
LRTALRLKLYNTQPKQKLSVWNVKKLQQSWMITMKI